MASGQLLAELGHFGEVGRQLLVEAQGLVVGLLRLRQPARGTQHTAPVNVAAGQLPAELGLVGKVGRQLLVEAHGLVKVLLRLLEFTQHVTHRADPQSSLRPHRPAIGVVPLDRGERIVLRDDAAQERPVVLRQHRPLGELPLDHVGGHAPQGGERLLPGLRFVRAGLLFRLQGQVLGVALSRRLLVSSPRPTADVAPPAAVPMSSR